MATTRFDSTRGTPHGEIATTSPAAAITGDVRLIVDHALTRDEIIVEIEKIRSKLIEIDWPPV